MLAEKTFTLAKVSTTLTQTPMRLNRFRTSWNDLPARASCWGTSHRREGSGVARVEETRVLAE